MLDIFWHDTWAVMMFFAQQKDDEYYHNIYESKNNLLKKHVHVKHKRFFVINKKIYDINVTHGGCPWFFSGFLPVVFNGLSEQCRHVYKLMY